jgi:hypothetical protein
MHAPHSTAFFAARPALAPNIRQSKPGTARNTFLRCLKKVHSFASPGRVSYGSDALQNPYPGGQNGGIASHLPPHRAILGAGNLLLFVSVASYNRYGLYDMIQCFLCISIIYGRIV